MCLDKNSRCNKLCGKKQLLIHISPHVMGQMAPATTSNHWSTPRCFWGLPPEDWVWSTALKLLPRAGSRAFSPEREHILTSWTLCFAVFLHTWWIKICDHHFNQQTSKLQQSNIVITSTSVDNFPISTLIPSFYFFLSLTYFLEGYFHTFVLSYYLDNHANRYTCFPLQTNF